MLTREQIEAMGPGREMDAAVAEQVMGWKRNGGFWQRERQIVAPIGSWSPSTDIDAAWKVVEKMGETHSVSVEWFGSAYRVNMTKRGDSWNWRNNVEHLFAPLAICRAALLSTLMP